MEALKLPTEVVDSAWKDDIDPNLGFELIGGNEKGEANYKNINAVPVKKAEVKGATTNYKTGKIGQIALFNTKDRLAA